MTMTYSKRNIFAHVLIPFGFVCSFSNAHANQPIVTTALAPVEKVFVPQGFDDNDNVEVIIQGRFPNSCMKTASVEKKIDFERQIIKLRPQVYVYSGEPCTQVIIPFTQRVTFGTLTPGTWKIIVDGLPLLSTLPLNISAALTTSPDDFLYAPVEEVVLLPGGQGNRQRLVVSGNWPRISGGGCFAMREIRTQLGSDDTLVVQPIAELLPASQCSLASQRRRVFQASKLLDTPLKNDSLIHVRTLNGESLNKFFEGQ